MVNNKKAIKLEDVDDDFGFSFMDDGLEETIEKEQSKVNELYSLMEKFLDNLSQNPEQTKLYWPNRVEKIKIFKDKLKTIKDRE